METIIYLEYGQNCFLECRNTYVAEWEGTEASGKGIQKVSRIARGYGHRAESERESHMWKKIEMYLKKETVRNYKRIGDAVNIYKGGLYLLHICQRQV